MGKRGSSWKGAHPPCQLFTFLSPHFSPWQTISPFYSVFICKMVINIKCSLSRGSAHVHRFSVCSCVWGDFVYSMTGMSWLGVTSFEFVSLSLTFNSPLGWSPPGIDESRSPYWADIKSAAMSCEVIRYDPSRTQTHMLACGTFWQRREDVKNVQVTSKSQIFTFKSQADQRGLAWASAWGHSSVSCKWCQVGAVNDDWQHRLIELSELSK